MVYKSVNKPSDKQPLLKNIEIKKIINHKFTVIRTINECAGLKNNFFLKYFSQEIDFFPLYFTETNFILIIKMLITVTGLVWFVLITATLVYGDLLYGREEASCGGFSKGTRLCIIPAENRTKIRIQPSQLVVLEDLNPTFAYLPVSSPLPFN